MVKNVIIVCDSASVTGGAERIAISSAIGLSDAGYNVYYFSAKGPIDTALLQSGVQVICLNQYDILSDPNRSRAIFQGLWNFKAEKEFRKLLRSLPREDTIIHFHSWTKALSASLFKVSEELDYHIVLTLHDYFSLCPNGGLFNYKKKHICYLKPMSLPCLVCDCDSRSYPQKIWRYLRQLIQNHYLFENKKLNFISISELNRSLLVSHLHHRIKKIYEVNNPVNFGIRYDVDIKANHLYLYIGRLSCEKGIDLFCEAMAQLHLQGCVLGDGYLLQPLQKKYPNIRFAGWVDGAKKDEYIKKCKALVFPSLWYEGAPLTILEMKSHGVPCIVPDLCAASEEIKDGVTGYIFKSGSLSSLENAIEKYEKTDLEEMQKNVIASFKPEKYLLSNYIKKLLSVYDSVLNEDS